MEPVESEGIERRVLRQLDRLGIVYEAVWIDPAAANTAMFCERYGFSLEESGNCILVATKSGKRRYAACLVQATRRLDVNHGVRRLLEARRVSFAPASETVEITGMVPDGVTPFGLPEGIPVFIDGPIMQLERVIVGGGSRKLKLLVPPAALARLESATVVTDLSLPPRA